MKIGKERMEYQYMLGESHVVTAEQMHRFVHDAPRDADGGILEDAIEWVQVGNNPD